MMLFLTSNFYRIIPFSVLRPAVIFDPLYGFISFSSIKHIFIWNAIILEMLIGNGVSNLNTNVNSYKSFQQNCTNIKN